MDDTTRKKINDALLSYLDHHFQGIDGYIGEWNGYNVFLATVYGGNAKHFVLMDKDCNVRDETEDENKELKKMFYPNE